MVDWLIVIFVDWLIARYARKIISLQIFLEICRNSNIKYFVYSFQLSLQTFKKKSLCLLSIKDLKSKDGRLELN